MYDSSIADIFSTVPDKALVVDGHVLQLVEGKPLPDWQPGNERARSADDALYDFGTKGKSPKGT